MYKKILLYATIFFISQSTIIPVTLASQIVPKKETVVIANGLDYSDALKAEPIHLFQKIPYLLSSESDLPTILKAYLAQHQLTRQVWVADTITFPNPLDGGVDKMLSSGFTDKLLAFYQVKSQAAVYQDPSQESLVLDELPQGRYVKSFGSDGVFVKISYEQLNGYVKIEQLDINQDPYLFKVIDGTLIVNKNYALPSDYDPGLDPETESAFLRMQQTAGEQGLYIRISSGYRSYSLQDRYYYNYLDVYGEETNYFSAQPGHSEHQAGLALDIADENDQTTINTEFEYTPESDWMKKHAHEFGFILRYPENKEVHTGYMYESWHYRYVGTELAKILWETGLTLEEYFLLSI